jgi:hypothetical protein
MIPWERIESAASSGTLLPETTFRVKGPGIRRGEKALVYLIPNAKRPEKPSEKGFNISEFGDAYRQLVRSGEFTTAWFRANLAECFDEGDCNFKAIGAVFLLLGKASYTRGKYSCIR